MRCLSLTTALAVSLVALAAHPATAVADRLPAAHERSATWRTVVIPEPVLIAPARPAQRPKGIETASIHPEPPAAVAPRLLGPGHALDGIASYYWQEQMTASGARFDRRAMTAAHRTLPFGTKVRVTHARTGRSVIVTINDRGPFKKGRVIDLSEAAAEAIGMTGTGLAHVQMAVVSR